MRRRLINDNIIHDYRGMGYFLVSEVLDGEFNCRMNQGVFTISRSRMLQWVTTGFVNRAALHNRTMSKIYHIDQDMMTGTEGNPADLMASAPSLAGLRMMEVFVNKGEF